MKRSIRAIFRHDYVKKASFILHFYIDNLQKPPPLIIYQMGKVGSSTIASSLNSLQLPNPIYHIHTLTKAGIESSENIYREMYGNASVPFNRSKHLTLSKCLRRQLDRGLRGKILKLVTLVREPIARNISGFFQLRDRWFPNFINQYNQEAISTADIKERFLAEYEHQEPLDWFDNEIKHVFGIDVFATEFPKSKGYAIYSGDNVEILLIKLEKLAVCAKDAFRDFLDIDQFVLVKANISSEKEYAEAYKKLIDTVVLPKSYLYMMYSSKYVQHFYDEQEINRFKAKWSKSRIHP